MSKINLARVQNFVRLNIEFLFDWKPYQNHYFYNNFYGKSFKTILGKKIA